MDYKESENNEEKERYLKNKNKNRKNNFKKYLIKNESEYEEEEDFNKNKILKTDYNEGGNILIKSTLKHLAKEGRSSDEISSSITKNKINHKSFNTPFNEKNDFNFNNKGDISDDNKNKNLRNRIFKFQEEEKITGDKTRNKKKRNKKFKNKNGDIYSKESDSIIITKNGTNNFDNFYKNALGSSVASFLSIENKKKVKDKNIFLSYWEYFRRRELFLVCFFDKNDTIPFFVRWSSFFFCFIFILMLNCLFFFVSNVHKRYLNASEGKNNDIIYYFKKEFIKTIYVTLISNVFKMIIVKLVLNRAFKVKKIEKKMMHNSYENYIEESEIGDLEQKRYDYLFCYHIKLIIYFCLLFIFGLFVSYICICYGGVFPNSINAFFFGLLFSLILSFIVCAIICFIIMVINKIARILKNRCLLSAYIVLSTVY